MKPCSASAPLARDPWLLAEVATVYVLGVGLVVLVDRGPSGIAWAQGWLPAAIWIYLPLAVLLARRVPVDRFGLDLSDWRGGLADAAVVLALMLPAYAVGHLLFRVGYPGNALVAPDLTDIAQVTLTNVLAIALPEELFFRGYLLTRLEDALGRDRALWGGRLGLAVVLSALLFNAAHPLAGGSWWQGNLPFGILLGWLWCRRGTLVAPVLVHGFTNVAFHYLEHAVR